jgi:hypothetical protein
MVAGIFTILIALAMMFFAGFWPLGTVAMNNIHVVCPLILAFAITSLWELNRNVRYLNVPLAAWLVLAPLLLDGPLLVPKLVLILGGLTICVLALLPRGVKGRYGGGWKSLFQSAPPHNPGP